MEYRYLKREKDLQHFAARTELFLSKHDFDVAKKEEKNSVKIVGVRRQENHEIRRVEIALSIIQQDLSIKFEWGENSDFLKTSSLLTFLGGGLIFKKKILTAEFYKEMEERYWRDIEILADELRSP